MPKSTNSYFKGLNQDNSRSKYDPTNYYDALNLKVITHDGLSTGSIENEKGNSLTFVVPDVPAETITHSDASITAIPLQENLKIIGWCGISKYIVLFTTNEHGENRLTKSIGQIWKLEYNEISNKVKDVSYPEQSLTVADHLIYNGEMNLSSYYRIESEGRYENSATVRVYWTDFNNPLRTVNILDPKLRNIKPDVMDTNPNITFNMPFPINVGVGNLPVGGKIQYAYRLISKTGAQSVVSPISNLVTLTTINPNDIDNYTEMNSNGPAYIPDTSTDVDRRRSVTFRVQDIDRDYDIIEHIAVLYTSKDTPYIYKFGEETIPTDGTMDVEIVGTEVELPLTSVEFNLAESGFSRCKTIDAKNNYLIAGNIIKDVSEVSTEKWDSRAYRFADNRKAQLYDLNANIILDADDVGGPDYASVPVEHDAVNPYNREFQEGYENWKKRTNQCKFQKDGTTLGGSGKNISYTFDTYEVDLDDNGVNQTRKAPWLKANKITDNYENGVMSPDGNLFKYNINDQFNNFASPIIEALFTGYARGEVYRFGIQFYTKKGGVTFVNWIGDIRFPEPINYNDGNQAEVLRLEVPALGIPNSRFPIGDAGRQDFDVYDSNHTRTPEDRMLKGFSLGVKFQIDITGISDEISGFRIVRSERTESDMTRLGTGVIMLFDKKDYDDDYQNPNTGLYETVFPNFSSTSIQVGTSKLRWNDSEGKFWHLPDLPGMNTAQVREAIHGESGRGTRQHTILFSPLTTKGIRNALNFEFADSDSLKTLGYYKSTAWSYRSHNSDGHVEDNFQRQAWVWKCRKYLAAFHDRELFKIKKLNYYDGGIRVAGEERLETIDNQNAEFLNVSYGRNNGSTNKKYPFGVGDDICHTMLEPWWGNIDTDLGEKPASNMLWSHNVRSGAVNSFKEIELKTNSRNPDSWVDARDRYTTQNWSFKEVAYTRDSKKQYGGSSFENRSKTIYMSTGHYQPITDEVLSSGLLVAPNTFNFQVFGGDTTVHVLDRDYIQQYQGEDNQDVQNPQDGLHETGEFKLNVALMFPCESRINLEFGSTTDIRFSTNRISDSWSDGVGGHLQDKFGFDEFYTQRNNVEAKFIAKDFAVTVLEEYPHRLWISDPKIDGELLDSWTQFKASNILDVDGSYGPINKVINFQDRLTFYQSRAIGVAAINERSLVTDTSGIQLALGTGTVLEQFRYLSTTTGTSHQFSVVASTSSLYHYDAILRKMYKLTKGLEPLSDMKGMSSFLAKNVDGPIVDTDITLRTTLTTGGIGVHSVFDFRHNRALFTFLTPKKDIPNFTIGYNEFMDAYESFYSFTPEMYLSTGRRIISIDPDENNSGNIAYLHDEGDYNSFYGDVVPTEITLLVAPQGNMANIFTNIEYNSEVSFEDVQVYNETLSSLEIFNDYQETGIIPLIVGENIKRRMRHWRHVIGRATDSSASRARIRDYSIFLKLSYTNSGNKRLVLHDVMVAYTPARD